MGLRLKSQLIALCLALMLISLGALSYFHLTLSSHDNLTSSDLSGRRTAALAFQQVQLFVRSSNHPNDLVQAMSNRNASDLTESLAQTPDLLQFDLFLPDGTKVIGSGVNLDSGLQFQQAVFWIQEHQEVYCQIWGVQDGESTPMVSVGPFYQGQVVHHSYHPLYDDTGQLLGLVHFVVQLPKAPLRINLIVVGYATVATIFLISSMLAIYLWAEFALNRPLRGLTNSLQQLRSLDPSGHPPDRLPQPNELSEAARALNRVTLDLIKYQRELQLKTDGLQQANSQYRELNEELEQKVAEKTLQIREFFSLITHDLRIPLAAVSGYSELMQNPRSGSLSDKQTRYLQHIQLANSHAQELVRNLLEVMKYEFGNPGLEPERFDLCELITEVKNQLALEEKPIEVIADPSQSWLVWGDRSRLGRVFSNLMSNALHHAGHVQVELTPENHAVGVTVRDQGPGIAAEELPRLFEKFKGSSNSSGLGLGLYIVFRILQDHGQSIAVESQSGEGTRFRFQLNREEKQ